MEVHAEGAALRQQRKCGDCGGFDFVEDHAAGDIVCRVRACGLPSCPMAVDAAAVDALFTPYCPAPSTTATFQQP